MPATQASYFLTPDFQQLAHHIAEALLNQQPVTREKLGKATSDIQLLIRELALAPPQQPADELVRSLLLDIASAVNPYLPASRLTPLWDHLANQPGYSLLSESTRDWFALHRAVGSRDAVAMAAMASHLIETTPKDKLSAQEASYLLTVGLTGYLAINDKAKAGALLEIFVKQQIPVDNKPLYLLLLLQQITAKT